MMASSSNIRGVARILSKLENSVKTGDYYEAHQMYRTLYFRYLSQHKYEELLNMLYDGAELFLNCDQQGSGADLSILLVDVLEKCKSTDATKWIPKLTKLFSKMSDGVPEREQFLMDAIRWLKGCDSRSGGHPLFHQNIAEVFWHEKNYVQARYHYVRSCDGQGCARLLIEFQSVRGFGHSELDLFIAQTVLQYLCLANAATAAQTFVVYTQHHPSIRCPRPPYLWPLLNFLWFLLKAIENRKLTQFTILCEQYQPSIKRDPYYVQYLEKIAQIFFDVKPTQPQHNGTTFLSSILQNFFGGMDDDLNDEIQQHPQPSTSTMQASELD